MAVNEGKQLKYFQLMEDLKEKILSGEIQAGDKLPSENELSGRVWVISMRNMAEVRSVRNLRAIHILRRILRL